MPALKNMTFTREPEDLVEREFLHHCVVHKTSFLCAKEAERDCCLELRESANGWHLGTSEFRDSEYFETETAAQEALDNRSWCQQMDP